ncbi:hypothetical protein T439DRAFT_95997 [Meredithblackwellia eburnea MCA 4105]
MASISMTSHPDPDPPSISSGYTSTSSGFSLRTRHRLCLTSTVNIPLSLAPVQWPAREHRTKPFGSAGLSNRDICCCCCCSLITTHLKLSSRCTIPVPVRRPSPARFAIHTSPARPHLPCLLV